MNTATALRNLRSELLHELRAAILPYWMFNTVDVENGGFVGALSGDDARVADAPKGAVLNARILWTFSAAYRVLHVPAYRAIADRAASYLRSRFLDSVHGGVYWMLDAAGQPLSERKHLYAQAFAIYALSEHYRATQDERSLKEALGISRLVEEHARDRVRGGYQEAFSRDWRALPPTPLGEGDPDAPRTMNTHLHLVEAYANLWRARPSRALRSSTAALLQLVLERILDPASGHLRLYFDVDWTPLPGPTSYGHDIEASWLLLEAADTLGEPELRERARANAVRMAEVLLAEALDPEGGLLDGPPGEDAASYEKEWWPQAEAIVGFLNAYELTVRESFLQAACDVWAFTQRAIVDARGGEWRRRVARDGSPLPGTEKVGPWKCPYHNARACLEVMARVERMLPPVATS